MADFFRTVPEAVAVAGAGDDSALAFQVYDPDRILNQGFIVWE